MSASAADAIPPPNDDFADAYPLPAALPLSQGGSLVDATKETGEPDVSGSFGDGGKSVWFTWTPAATGYVRFGTCGGPAQDGAASISIYTGATFN